MSLAGVLNTLLVHPKFRDCSTRAAFVQEWPELLDAFSRDPALSESTTQFCTNVCTRDLKDEIATLANKESGWHFSARKAQAAQIEGFSLKKMAHKLEGDAPQLWALTGALLQADPVRLKRRLQFLGMDARDVETSDPKYWNSVGHLTEEEIFMEDEPRPAKKRRRIAAERMAALLRIKRVVIISIMLHNTNQKCNPFASIMGLFLHSTSAPELVIDVLSHAGLSISVSAVHHMVDSLSSNASAQLRELMKTCTAAFAYDNFDMDFKSYSPTVDKPGITLLHGTSALAFPLNHGITEADLKCSKELWETDPLNP
ncbi:hypothetical protein K474DRAFT_1601281, partial [Panus rudis PR-1116 ss-1]